MSTDDASPLRRVLVANRGEIALRVIRGARECGIETVAIASEVDAAAPHAVAADRCIVIGPGPAAESYLDQDAVLAAARESGADAVHPGYGFFAENAAFAQAVLDAGLIWIGPPPAVIDALGDKLRAKALAKAAGVPTVPGYEGEVDNAEAAEKAAAGIGYPVLVKAAAGGGGRGMRVVERPEALREALEGAAREAKGAFGSGRVFLEKYVSPARHVEIQVVADMHGEVVHLGERECSLQRRYQKVVEEAPSAAVDAELRERMGAAAVSLTREAGYVGAGTVEFLLAPDGSFYFLEVNTRLQVEHPVTELVTGVDLVALQLRVAAGRPLGLSQADISSRGHAIELRICAEDPGNRFTPQVGRVMHLELPTGPGVRVDSGIVSGSEVSPHYDSLLMKLIVHAADRATAVTRARDALRQLVILGPRTNVEYLGTILALPEYERNDVHTGFLAEALSDWKPSDDGVEDATAAALAADLLDSSRKAHVVGAEPEPTAWTDLGGWRTMGHDA